MAVFKNYLKAFFNQALPGSRMKQMHFYWERLYHFRRNKNYRKTHPSAAIPDDKWLFETYRLDYRNYFEDGDLAAKEILEWTSEWLEQPMPVILDWGCGTGRIIQHLHKYAPYTLLYGSDTNHTMVEWDGANIKDVHFSGIQNLPPTNYPTHFFDLVYGISVLTHLPETDQKIWIAELSRILKPGAILLVTTHGNFFKHRLLSKEKKALQKNGIAEQGFRDFNKRTPAGDRNFSAYQTAEHFEQLISPYFLILSYFDGAKYPEKFGGQDLWILQKK